MLIHEKIRRKWEKDMLESIISLVAIILIMVYVIAALWFIGSRKTVLGTVGMAAAFEAGGLIIIPVAHIIAPSVFWIVVIWIVLLGIGSTLE